MNEFDENIITKSFIALTEDEEEDLKATLDRFNALPFSIGEMLSQLMQSGYRIVFENNFPQYLRGSIVRNGGGAIVAVGANGFIYQKPGQSKVLLPYGIFTLLLP